MQQSYIKYAAGQPGYNMEKAYKMKLDRFPELSDRGIKLVPLVWETTGGASDSVHTLFQDLAMMEAKRTGLRAKEILFSLHAKISCCLQRSLSRAFISRRPFVESRHVL